MMMNLGYYEIDWSDGTQLRYKIDDNPISHIWKSVTQYYLKQKDVHIFNNQWAQLKHDPQLVEELWDRMYADTVRYNNNPAFLDTYIEMPEKYSPDIDWRPLLNHLHEEFHTLAEAMVEHEMDLNVYNNPLHQLNIDIHKLECQLQGNHGWTDYVRYGFFLHSVILGRYVQKIEDPGLYKYFRCHDRANGLHLGYHTVGKGLLHCVHDNDVELVRKGLVRQQDDIHNEVIQTFIDEEPVDAHEEQIEVITEWIINNKLQDKVDLTDPMMLQTGKPFLGELDTKKTVDEINELFAKAEVIEVRIIDANS